MSSKVPGILVEMLTKRKAQGDMGSLAKWGFFNTVESSRQKVQMRSIGSV